MSQHAPDAPKKMSRKKKAGIGVGVVFALIVIGGIASGGDGASSSDSAPTQAKPKRGAAAESDERAPAEPVAKAKPKTGDSKAVFKVWGTAPDGALGSLDITYGSDSDNRKGEFKGGKFEASLPANKDAMYFNVMAQLQGDGDIHCSVTIGDKTKKGHASGGYNICDAQLNAGVLGGFN